jgi:hypothetical protein
VLVVSVSSHYAKQGESTSNTLKSILASSVLSLTPRLTATAPGHIYLGFDSSNLTPEILKLPIKPPRWIFFQTLALYLLHSGVHPRDRDTSDLVQTQIRSGAGEQVGGLGVIAVGGL